MKNALPPLHQLVLLFGFKIYFYPITIYNVSQRDGEKAIGQLVRAMRGCLASSLSLNALIVLALLSIVLFLVSPSTHRPPHLPLHLSHQHPMLCFLRAAPPLSSFPQRHLPC
jgi:hypothetical protein